MKLSEAIENGKVKNWLCANIRRDPSFPTQWFVMLTDIHKRSHMLVDENESPIVSDDLNYFTELFEKIAVPEFTVFL